MEKAASWLLARKRSLHDKRLARYKISLLSEVPAPDLGYFFRKGACLLEHVKAGRGIGCRYRVQAQAAALGDIPEPAEELVTWTREDPRVRYREAHVVLDGAVTDAGDDAADSARVHQVGHRLPSLYHGIADLLGRDVNAKRQRHGGRRMLARARGDRQVVFGQRAVGHHDPFATSRQ